MKERKKSRKWGLKEKKKNQPCNVGLAVVMQKNEKSRLISLFALYLDMGNGI